MTGKCVHCGNDPEVGMLLPNGDRSYPLHYGGAERGYVDLITTLDERYGLGPGRIRLNLEPDTHTRNYLVLTVAMLRQMLSDIAERGA